MSDASKCECTPLSDPCEYCRAEYRKRPVAKSAYSELRDECDSLRTQLQEAQAQLAALAKVRVGTCLDCEATLCNDGAMDLLRKNHKYEAALRWIEMDTRDPTAPNSRSNERAREAMGGGDTPTQKTDRDDNGDWG